jgi:8-oxo-dGTP pyrophosphatase MutT (NUDIX family)
MHRENILKLLDEYQPTQEELKFKNQLIEFINNYEDCFERHLEVGHITGSAWLINKTGDKALLMHHTKLDMWLQLGGHADGDSDILRVATREAQEESGIMDIKPVSDKIFDIDVHLIPDNPKEKAHYHYDIRFLLQVQSDEDIQINNESKELRWVSNDPSELTTNSPSVTRMFDKWIKKSWF